MAVFGVNARTGLVLSVALLVVSAPASGFGLDEVIQQASELAQQDWQAPDEPRSAINDLSYDQYRAIRFDPEQALWADASDYRVQFFHPGFLYPDRIPINEVVDRRARPVPFKPENFRFDAPLDGPPLEDAAGYAGFRVHYPINRSDRHDEFLVFLGASYFRLIGRDQNYGLSARGLALDSGGQQPEEFPAFREFWLVRPGAEEDLVVLALLDSPSVTGAYRFAITPGSPSSMLVDAYLFAREDLGRAGIAPLTSMYTHGDTGPLWSDDFRPRVHDSDGLAVLDSRGQMQWRPLSNRGEVRISAFVDSAAPRGFGLEQRRAELRDFEDLEARYERRPGKWIEPLGGDWGAGQVELIEIPTADETHDNIVVFWVPEMPILAGQSRHFRYRLTTLDAGVPDHGPARVAQTRTGRTGTPGEDKWRQRQQRRFVIDFQGEALEPADRLSLAAETSAGELLEARLETMPAAGRVRAVLALAPDKDGAPSDLRAWLQYKDEPVSEIWTYVWYPDELNRAL